MIGFYLMIFVSFPLLASAGEHIPTWVFPILDSKFIGKNCSEDTNVVVMQLNISRAGEIKSFKFVKKSSIAKINKEAEKNILALSPFEEFEYMSKSDVEKFSVVNMSYSIPCKNV